jgi:hypothetical protein
VVAARRCAGLGAVAPGLQQPGLQQAAAHAGHAGVEQREQRGRVFAAQGFDQLQVAPRGGGQVDQVVARCTCTLCMCVSWRPWVCSA